ncbi:uncharacterized protein DNG_10024 [Cephalotrichum gorgonifer]|uniref:Chromosome segregation in meiosis protein n=1 Tax=Cephalotrichum gorgonifer TaxID=2041049 RepID=A0AAE8N962_9PEZI|nr:uncharacterized protein DNG_10024 [Cephalotrichum gorgonifer]
MPADARPSDRRPPADLDDYEVDLDDIFGDLTPPPGQEDEGTKRKARENGAADDDDAPVAKRARAPRVKLDEQRLLSDEGIPKLRARAKGLKFKGTSHEFSDTARLLDFYQLWLDDLFPKAKFLDALSMVEKTGHKTAVMTRRRDWIAEERRKELGTDGDHDDDAGREGAKTPPARRDFEREIDDIYTATPPGAANPSAGPVGAEQDEDDAALEALMMEADDDLVERGGGPPDEFAEDEAALAEMEFSTGWSNAPPAKPAPPPPDEYADDEAAMAEMGFP